MNTKIVALLICFGSVGLVQSAQFCQCSDYGSKSGCINFAGLCYWNNNECVQTISNCDDTPTNQCRPPSCQFNPLNQTCATIAKCADVVNATNSTCTAYGCSNSGGSTPTCKSQGSCSSIKSQFECQNFITFSNNKKNFCQWNQAIMKCATVFGCQGLDSNDCINTPFCTYIPDSNTCTYVSCGGLNQVSCDHAQSNCLWQNNTASSKAGQCGNNNCGNYGNETTCNTQANRNYCAWGGTSCNHCSKSTLMWVTGYTILFITALIF